MKEGEVIIEPKEAWKILYFKTNFAPFRPAGGKERPLTPKACTEMLSLLNYIRTFFKENPDAEF
ncbi:MAG: hypothetical protein PHE24_06275 [Patescibacteria group bacterium]|nr:hypothetical protein [Patescibacteria group bacterium]